MSRFRSMRACLAAGLVVLCASCTGGPSPDEPTDPPSSPSSPSASASPSATPADPTLTAEERGLLDQVRAKGQITVIVRLKLRQTPADDKARQAAISDAQDDLQAEVEPLEVEVQTRFKYVPMVTLAVDEAALLHLTESQLVDRIYENKVSKPG
jgi:hypothetical protein